MPATLRQKSFNPERQVYEYDIVSPRGETIGLAQLRLRGSKAPDMPQGFESNVYYEVDETERGKGYATDVLHSMNSEAKLHGLDHVIATVNESNIASRKVIEKCGYELLAHSATADGVNVLKYGLDLRQL